MGLLKKPGGKIYHILFSSQLSSPILRTVGALRLIMDRFFPFHDPLSATQLANFANCAWPYSRRRFNHENSKRNENL
jgi:hypothetical protein